MIFKQSTFTDRNNFTFHIREWIPETQAAGLIFLIHGLSDHGGRFTHVAEAAVENGFVFFAPDLRGNGNSQGKPGHFNSLTELFDDIGNLLDHAVAKHPALPVIMYGQSMGGNLVLSYCLDRKPAVKAVVSSSPWLKLAHPPGVLSRIMGSLLGPLIPSLSLSNGINADDLTHDSIVSNAYRNDPLVHGRITLNTFMVITDSGKSVLEHAGEWKLPLLLLHGTADKITSYSASKQFAVSCGVTDSFVSYPDLFHELHNEFGNKVIIESILKWVKSKL